MASASSSPPSSLWCPGAGRRGDRRSALPSQQLAQPRLARVERQGPLERGARLGLVRGRAGPCRRARARARPGAARGAASKSSNAFRALAAPRAASGRAERRRGSPGARHGPVHQPPRPRRSRLGPGRRGRGTDPGRRRGRWRGRRAAGRRLRRAALFSRITARLCAAETCGSTAAPARTRRAPPPLPRLPRGAALVVVRARGARAGARGRACAGSPPPDVAERLQLLERLVGAARPAAHRRRGRARPVVAHGSALRARRPGRGPRGRPRAAARAAPSMVAATWPDASFAPVAPALDAAPQSTYIALSRCQRPAVALARLSGRGGRPSPHRNPWSDTTSSVGALLLRERAVVAEQPVHLAEVGPRARGCSARSRPGRSPGWRGGA